MHIYNYKNISGPLLLQMLNHIPIHLVIFEVYIGTLCMCHTWMMLDIAGIKLRIVADFTCVASQSCFVHALSLRCINHTIHLRSGRKWLGAEAKTNLKILNKVRNANRANRSRVVQSAGICTRDCTCWN